MRLPDKCLVAKQISTFRLSAEHAEIIGRLADRFGVTQATVIRWAVDALIRYAEKHGDRLVLPIDFTEVWAEVTREAAGNQSAEAPAPESGNALPASIVPLGRRSPENGGKETA